MNKTKERAIKYLKKMLEAIQKEDTTVDQIEATMDMTKYGDSVYERVSVKIEYVISLEEVEEGKENG
jgi:hypothetical protein